MRNYFSILLLIFIISACSVFHTKKSIDNQYSVITNFISEDERDIAFEKISISIPDTLIKLDDNGIIIGMFGNFRAACDRGFELFADAIIDNFDVIYEDSVIANDYYDLYFIGEDLERAALYKTELLLPQPNLIWSKWGHGILELYRSENRQEFFFTTALHKGIRGSFPLIMNTKLFHFNRDAEHPKIVNTFGNVMHIDGNWDDDSTFIILYSTLDSMLTSTIYQRQFHYNIDGELINSSERIFELVKDGIPVPKFSNINPVSNDLRYKLLPVKTDTSIVLNLIDELNGTKNFITELKGEIKANGWNTTSDYLFLTSQFQKDSTELIIVNLREMNLTRRFSDVGEMNFIIIGNLLIFDTGFMKNSYITLYRYKRDKIYSTIRITGGCGINSIPKANRIF